MEGSFTEQFKAEYSQILEQSEAKDQLIENIMRRIPVIEEIITQLKNKVINNEKTISNTMCKW